MSQLLYPFKVSSTPNNSSTFIFGCKFMYSFKYLISVSLSKWIGAVGFSTSGIVILFVLHNSKWCTHNVFFPQGPSLKLFAYLLPQYLHQSWNNIKNYPCVLLEVERWHRCQSNVHVTVFQLDWRLYLLFLNNNVGLSTLFDLLFRHFQIFLLLFFIIIIFGRFFFLFVLFLFLCVLLACLSQNCIEKFLERFILFSQSLFSCVHFTQMARTQVNIPHNFYKLWGRHTFWPFMVGFWALKTLACPCRKHRFISAITLLTVMRRTSEELNVCRWRWVFDVCYSLTWWKSELVFVFFFIKTVKMVEVVTFSHCTLEQRLFVIVFIFVHVIGNFGFFIFFGRLLILLRVFALVTTLRACQKICATFR